MRKFWVVIFLVMVMLLSQYAFANVISGSSLVDLANNELEMANLIDEPYFHSERNTRGKPLSINQYLAGERNLIVYGDPHGYDSETGRNRYLGYTMSNAPFTNYLFRNDATSSVGLWNRNWVPNPKYNSKTMDRPEVQGEDNFNNLIRYKESIKLGLQHISRKKPDGTLLDFPEDKIDDRQWHRYVHVYQPPTSVSWGSGIMFHTTSEGKVWYLTVPMSPEGIPKPEDLEANFNPLPSSAAKGTDTLIGVNIESSFKQDLQDIPFQWEVTKADGTPLNATDDSLEFKVASTVQNAAGTINIPSIRKEATLYVSFKMPDSGVKIKFKVNETGNQPKETNVTNNIIEAEIRPIESITITNQPYDLPYNVLSKRMQFPLANGREITADLHLPNGSWISNATGSLDVKMKPQLYLDISVMKKIRR
ncbi:MAG: hypothetical protein M0Z31_09430 [Clostridia bacterium]|nr:hypothetical protein [Clostridia bacterium]